MYCSFAGMSRKIFANLEEFHRGFLVNLPEGRQTGTDFPKNRGKSGKNSAPENRSAAGGGWGIALVLGACRDRTRPRRGVPGVPAFGKPSTWSEETLPGSISG